MTLDKRIEKIKTAFIKDQIRVKEAEIEKLRTEIAQIQNSFFTSENAREFFMDLEPMSLQCGCSVTSLDLMPDATADKGKDSRASTLILKRASVDITGKYENIMKFLGRLNDSHWRISISNLCIESDQSDDEKLICGMIITIYVVEDKEIITDEQNQSL